MARNYLKVQTSEGTYYVDYDMNTMFGSINIYTYNPNRLLFKYKNIVSYIYCAIVELASHHGVDKNSDNFLVELANFAVNMHVDAQKAAKEAAIKHSRQQECFQRACERF